MPEYLSERESLVTSFSDLELKRIEVFLLSSPSRLKKVILQVIREWFDLKIMRARAYQCAAVRTNLLLIMLPARHGTEAFVGHPGQTIDSVLRKTHLHS